MMMPLWESRSQYDRCIHVDDAVWALFHLVDDNCNAVRDPSSSIRKRFLADQLRCDLAHRLVGDGILIVKPADLPGGYLKYCS